MVCYIVTGGSGFIGSALIRYLFDNSEALIVNIDKLTYAACNESLREVEKSPRYQFFHQDITELKKIHAILEQVKPDGIFHLAAESHVDRSIEEASDFINTNVVGTFTMLEAYRNYCKNSSKECRFLHVSTDEVYGSLGAEGLFHEDTPYDPRSPYSASKAASDHLASAWYHTYDLPILMTNCSNNYGLYQFPEKLIPLMIINAFMGKTLPIYGDGENIRDWLFVEDHARALFTVMEKGIIGEKYNIGGNSERSNKQVVYKICELIDELANKEDTKSLIKFVKDRPGHDRRYAIDASKIKRELGFSPEYDFENGLRNTVLWYLENQNWWRAKIEATSERKGLIK